jgi:hypothetical protein
MNLYSKHQAPRYKDTTGWPHKVFDAWLLYGPLAAEKAAADERHEQARQWAVLWNMMQPVHARRPGVWRRWAGAFLVRVGRGLQGLHSLAADATPAG